MKILYTAEAVVEGGREGHGRTSDGRLEEHICAVQDSSDLHAELKQVLGPRCLGYARPRTAEPEMEQVS